MINNIWLVSHSSFPQEVFLDQKRALIYYQQKTADDLEWDIDECSYNSLIKRSAMDKLNVRYGFLIRENSESTNNKSGCELHEDCMCSNSRSISIFYSRDYSEVFVWIGQRCYELKHNDSPL